jgi:hypothetical protein
VLNIPRYWLSGEEKKLLWKLRNKEIHSDSGDYWSHLIPRNDEELNFMLETIPDNAIGDYRTNESFSWKEKQTAILPDGTREIHEIIYQANLQSSMWYFEPLQPFTIHPMPEGIPENPYETKEWIPQVFDVANNTWRKATQWECEHWHELVECSNCHHPTIPQFECNACGDTLKPPLKDVEKRVLNLICILPDTTDFATTEEEVLEEIEPSEETEERESTEFEDIIEEEVSEELTNGEEDEENKDPSIT